FRLVREGLARFLRETWLGFVMGIAAPLIVWGLAHVDWGKGSSETHRTTAPGPPLRAPLATRSFLQRLIPPPGGRLPGVHVLAPDLDVSASTDQPLGGRAFSDSAKQVGRYATATVSAYRSEHMLSAPGHFPGLGAAAQSTDASPTEVGLSIKDLLRRDVVPF